MKTQDPPPTPVRPGLLETIKAVLSALVGIQSEQNRRRHFTQGRAGHFVLVGALATLAFVLGIWLLVKLVMRLAGG